MKRLLVAGLMLTAAACSRGSDEGSSVKDFNSVEQITKQENGKYLVKCNYGGQIREEKDVLQEDIPNNVCLRATPVPSKQFKLSGICKYDYINAWESAQDKLVLTLIFDSADTTTNKIQVVDISTVEDKYSSGETKKKFPFANYKSAATGKSFDLQAGKGKMPGWVDYSDAIYGQTSQYNEVAMTLSADGIKGTYMRLKPGASPDLNYFYNKYDVVCSFDSKFIDVEYLTAQ